jgi:N-acetylglutamate synthase-like GNAT family acetyltransferase
VTEIREASLQDVKAVAKLINRVWPGELPSFDRIERVRNRAGHTLLVADQDKRAVGFVSGFVTTAQDGTRRCELDLLAVDPQVQGQGIGKQLIQNCTPVAQNAGAEMIRALVRSDNQPMMRACLACGYRQEPDQRHLMIAGPTQQESDLETPEGLHLVEVNTLTYSGLWLEGKIGNGAFAYGRDAAKMRGLETVGALIPAANAQLIHDALSAGYEEVAPYIFWTCVV